MNTFQRWPPMSLFLACAMFFPGSGAATFSIVACEAESGRCGVAVATNNLAVGASVAHVRAGVGALVSQFETNPSHGPAGLRLLAEGKDAQAAVKLLLEGDGDFEGQGIEARQIGIVSVRGDVASHTGAKAKASRWAGARSGRHYSIQGNGLTGEDVVLAMEKAYLASKGTLPGRLMSALRAGQAAGGQRTGTMSAALLVRTHEGWPHDIDLRVDAGEKPVQALYRLLALHDARQAILRAERLARSGDTEQAWVAVAEALHLGPSWDRIWRRAARLSMRLGEKSRALDYLGVFVTLNPTWATTELEDDLYAPLRPNPLFQSWTTRP